MTSKNAQIIKNKDKNENIINTNTNIDTKVSIDTLNIQNNEKHDLSKLTNNILSNKPFKLISIKSSNVKQLKIEIFLCRKRLNSITNDFNKFNNDNFLTFNKSNHNSKNSNYSKFKNYFYEYNRKTSICKLNEYKKISDSNLSSFDINNIELSPIKSDLNNSSFIDIKNFCKQPKNNLNNIEKEKLLNQRINQQHIIIENQLKEISLLQKTLEDKNNTISLMEEKNNDYKSEIKKCYFDISKILKELFDLKRENRFRWIVEQEYQLGNKSLIYKNDFGIKKNNEYWNDGILFKDIKNKLNLNKTKIDLLNKVKNDENTFLNSFNLNLLIKEKNDLNEELIKLKSKNIHFHILNIYMSRKKYLDFHLSKKMDYLY